MTADTPTTGPFWPPQRKIGEPEVSRHPVQEPQAHQQQLDVKRGTDPKTNIIRGTE